MKGRKMLGRITASLLSALMIVSSAAAVDFASPFMVSATTADEGVRLENLSELSTDTIVKGESITAYGDGGGGTGDYQYAFYYKRTTQDTWTCVQKFSSSSTAVITPTAAVEYEVRCVVKDSSGTTSVKEFSLHVLAPLKNTSSLSKKTIAKGSSVTIKGSAAGSTGSYQFAYYYKQASKNTWTCASAYSTSTSVDITPAASVDYDVRVKAKDSLGHIVNKDLTLQVVPPLSNTSTISKKAITKGESVTVNASASGGSGEYTYAFYYKRQSQNSWTAAKRYSADTTAEITPTAAVPYDIRVNVRDSIGNVTEKLFVLNVATPLKNSASLSKTLMTKGSTLTVKGAASGGSGEYTFAYYYKQKAQTKWTCSKSFSTETSVTIKPLAATDYQVRVKVKDSYGTVANKDLSFTCVGSLKNTSTADRALITKGESVTLTGSASGGIPPYSFGYYYKRHSNESWTRIKDYSQDTSAAATPTAAVDYDLAVRVKDSEGTIVERVIPLQVITPLKNSSTLENDIILKGMTVTVTGKASGGGGDYTYAYYYKQDSQNNWTRAKDYSTDTSAQIKPAAATSYTVRVDVKDSLGNVEQKLLPLRVVTPLINYSSVSESAIMKGESVTLTASARGGTGGYNYAFYYKQNSQNNYTCARSFSTVSSVEITPCAAVDYDILIKVRDSSGAVVEKSHTLTVLPVLKNTSSVSGSSVMAGKSLSLNASASGGSSQYVYAYYYKRTYENEWTMFQDYSGDSQAVLTLRQSGDYDIRIDVQDASGHEVQKQFMVSVLEVLEDESDLDYDVIRKGESVTLTGGACGGTGDYTFTYLYKQNSQNSWTLAEDLGGYAVITPSEAVDHVLCVRTTDSAGNTIDQIFSLTVLDELKNTSTISASSITTTDAVDINGSATGGAEPYQYAYSFMKQGGTAWLYNSGYSTSAYQSFTFGESGVYVLRVSVKDSMDYVVYKDFTLTVTGPFQNTSTIDSNQVSVGDAVVMRGSASGGKAPYSYAYYYRESSENNWTTAHDFSNVNVLNLTMTYAGIYEMKISAKDSNGDVESSTFTVWVVGGFENTSYIDNDTVFIGSSVTIYTQSADAVGNVDYIVSYRTVGSSTWIRLYPSATTANIIFTPPETGLYEIRVTAADESGASDEKSFTVNVKQDELNAYVDSILSRIFTPTMDDLDKVIAIHEWIVRNTEYDIEGYNSGNIPDSSFTAEGVFYSGKAVCDGYSKAFLKMAERAGFEAIRVTGYAYPSAGTVEAHAWNQIRLGGKWYNVDVTWDDPVTSGNYQGDNISYKYLLVPDSQFYTNHQADSYKNSCTDPQPTNRLISYALDQDLEANEDYAYCETEDDLSRAMQEFYNDDLMTFTLIYKTDETDTSKILQTVFNNGPAGHGMRFSYRQWRFDGYWQITVTLT